MYLLHKHNFWFKNSNIFRQRQLDEMKRNSQEKIQQKEKETQELRQAIFSLTVSADALSRHSHKVASLFLNSWHAWEYSAVALFNFFYKQSSLLAHFVALCLPLAFSSGSSWGERRRLHRTHPLNRAEALWSEGTNQSAGKGGSRRGRAAAGDDPEGNHWAAEERERTRPAVPHRGPRPFPSGNVSYFSGGGDSAAHSPMLSYFLVSVQSCGPLQAPPALSASPAVVVNPDLSFGPVMAAVSDIKGLLQEVCQGGFVSIYEKGRYFLFLSATSYSFYPCVFNFCLFLQWKM